MRKKKDGWRGRKREQEKGKRETQRGKDKEEREMKGERKRREGEGGPEEPGLDSAPLSMVLNPLSLSPMVTLAFQSWISANVYRALTPPPATAHQAGPTMGRTDQNPGSFQTYVLLGSIDRRMG